MKPHRLSRNQSRSIYIIVLSLLSFAAIGFQYFASKNLNLIMLPILALGGILTIYVYFRRLKKNPALADRAHWRQVEQPAGRA